MVDVVWCKIMRSVSDYFCASTYLFELAHLDFMPFQSCIKVESKTKISQLDEKKIKDASLGQPSASLATL